MRKIFEIAIEKLRSGYVGKPCPICGGGRIAEVQVPTDHDALPCFIHTNEAVCEGENRSRYYVRFNFQSITQDGNHTWRKIDITQIMRLMPEGFIVDMFTMFTQVCLEWKATEWELMEKPPGGEYKILRRQVV